MLITAALIGSVALPAAETSRILETLNDVEHVVEPGRLAADQLESGIAEEAAELQEYDRSRNATSLARFRAAMAEDGRLVDSLSRLVEGLTMPTPGDVATLVEMTSRWRTLTTEASSEPWSTARFAVTSPRREALRAAGAVDLFHPRRFERAGQCSFALRVRSESSFPSAARIKRSASPWCSSPRRVD